MWSTRGGADQIVGRLYDRFHDEFALNAVAVDLPHDPKRLTGGAHTELLLVQNAAVIKSAGFDLGDEGDAPQLCVTLNIPTRDGNGVQLKLGRMPTLMGLEVIEEPANPNWSEGNQFIYWRTSRGRGSAWSTGLAIGPTRSFGSSTGGAW